MHPQIITWPSLLCRLRHPPPDVSRTANGHYELMVHSIIIVFFIFSVTIHSFT